MQFGVALAVPNSFAVSARLVPMKFGVSNKHTTTTIASVDLMELRVVESVSGVDAWIAGGPLCCRGRR